MEYILQSCPAATQAVVSGLGEAGRCQSFVAPYSLMCIADADCAVAWMQQMYRLSVQSVNGGVHCYRHGTVTTTAVRSCIDWPRVKKQAATHARTHSHTHTHRPTRIHTHTHPHTYTHTHTPTHTYAHPHTHTRTHTTHTYTRAHTHTHTRDSASLLRCSHPIKAHLTVLPDKENENLNKIILEIVGVFK